MAAPDGLKRPARHQEILKNPSAPSRLPQDPGTPSAPPAGIQEARARLLGEQATRAARINATEAGQLLPAAEVAREWASICVGIRAALQAVPARLAAAHPGHPALIADLERELHEALAVLAADDL